MGGGNQSRKGGQESQCGEGSGQTGDGPDGAGRRSEERRGEEESFWQRASRIAYVELGLLPDQFLSLTPNELNALQEHKNKIQAQAKENAAFSGYCAGVAFALAWNGKLEGFSAFYHVPDAPVPAPPSTEDHIEMMRQAGEGGPPIQA